MPLATRPDALSRVIANALGIEPPEMLEIECGPNGEPWFIGFEWIGERDYLREGGASSARTRGANAFLKNGCDNLTATAAPSVDSLGLHMVLSLATIMMVWFGVQEALASGRVVRALMLGSFCSRFPL
jgi:hypothetical protein